MDKQVPNPNPSQLDELRQSNTNNLQWPSHFEFQQSLMQSFNPFIFHSQYPIPRGMPPLYGGYPAPPTRPEGEHDNSQPSSIRVEPPSQSQHDNSLAANSQPPSQSTDLNSTVVRGSNWSTLEDIRLCKAWVRVSEDPIIGSGQKKVNFWGRVFNDFKASHDPGEQISRNQKACDLRMQLIRSECNKWSAIIKKVHEIPHSGENDLMEERTAHELYRAQNGGKAFKLEHCWEILGKCKKFTMIMDGMNKKQVAKHIRTSTEALEVTNEPADGNIESSAVHSLENFDNTINVESPSLEPRPPGRKAAKRAKQQTSSEAHSAIGEKVAKSLEEMSQSSSVGWQRANDLYEGRQQLLTNKDKLAILNERLVMEENIAKVEKQMYDLDPIAMGSPSEKARRVVEMKNIIAALRAQADELITQCDLDSSTSTSRISSARNLETRFDEEASGDI